MSKAKKLRELQHKITVLEKQNQELKLRVKELFEEKNRAINVRG